jgi:hypothetical protein
MARLSLSLGNQIVWALVQPLAMEYIKEASEPGYQSVNLILTQSNPGPTDVDLEKYPKWAQLQIHSAIQSGQLINTGDKISKALEPEEVEKAVEKTTKKQAKNKSGSKDL